MNDVPYALLNLEDIPGEQTFSAREELKGKGEILTLRFEITEVYKGSKYDDTAISEINFNGTGVHCFALGTLIATPDGDIPVEQLKEGDRVLSYNTASRTIETSTVLATVRQHHHNLYELDFGKNKIITTDDHPFFYEGYYYSVEPNDKYGITTHKLEKKQKVHYLNNGKMNSLTLKSIKKLKVCEDTYTITGLDKNSLFFANGLCVSVE